MKKTLLALAVLATTAGSVNAAEIVKTDDATVNFYGQLREYLIKGSEDSDAAFTNSSSRIGVDLAYKTSDTLKVVGAVELFANDSKGGENRRHWIGVSSSDYGTLTIGKQAILSDDIWGVENDILGNGFSVLPEADGYDMKAIQQSILKYSIEGDAGWFKAAYSYDNGDQNPTTAEVYVGTSVSDFDIYGGVGYQDDRTNTSTTKLTVNGSNVESTTTSAKADKELTHGMFTVNYNGDGWHLGTTYWHAEVEDNNADSKLTSDSFALAGDYSITEKVSLYAAYEYILDFQEEGNDLNSIMGGVAYKYASWLKVYAEAGTWDQDSADSDYYWGTGARLYW